MPAGLGSMEKYGPATRQMPDRAFWLEAYDGGPYVVDRIDRGTQALKGAAAESATCTRSTIGDSRDAQSESRQFRHCGQGVGGRHRPLPPGARLMERIAVDSARGSLEVDLICVRFRQIQGWGHDAPYWKLVSRRGGGSGGVHGSAMRSGAGSASGRRLPHHPKPCRHQASSSSVSRRPPPLAISCFPPHNSDVNALNGHGSHGGYLTLLRLRRGASLVAAPRK